MSRIQGGEGEARPTRAAEPPLRSRTVIPPSKFGWGKQREQTVLSHVGYATFSRRMIARLKKHRLGYLYIFASYALIILGTWRSNPERTASEMLVFAVELPFWIVYVILVDGIPHMIAETAKGAHALVFAFLWLVYVGGGLFAVLWLVRRLVSTLRHVKNPLIRADSH